MYVTFYLNFQSTIYCWASILFLFFYLLIFGLTINIYNSFVNSREQLIYNTSGSFYFGANDFLHNYSSRLECRWLSSFQVIPTSNSSNQDPIIPSNTQYTTSNPTPTATPNVTPNVTINTTLDTTPDNNLDATLDTSLNATPTAVPTQITTVVGNSVFQSSLVRQQQYSKDAELVAQLHQQIDKGISDTRSLFHAIKKPER